MAKRKRLEIPETAGDFPVLETKSGFPPKARMPIAEVAGETAGRAALEEVAREMTAAETEGRVIKKIPLTEIESHHLCRDRMVLDPEEMEVLKASIAARGQQTPIEVVRLGRGYGLISGLRRLVALRDLNETHALALVRHPKDAQDAYQAMVEENEIRAGLSFFERAQIARASVGQGVYPNVQAAVAGLFAHVPKAKRSKIVKFNVINEALGKTLKFPTALSEHFGLALAQAISDDRTLPSRVHMSFAKAVPRDAAAERAVLERAMKKAPAKSPRAGEALAPGLDFQAKAGRVVLSGPALDADFIEALRDFAVSHAKPKE